MKENEDRYFELFTFVLRDEREGTYGEDVFKIDMDKCIPKIKEQVIDLLNKVNVPVKDFKVEKEYKEGITGLIFKKPYTFLKKVTITVVFKNDDQEEKVCALLNGFKWGYWTAK